MYYGIVSKFWLNSILIGSTWEGEMESEETKTFLLLARFTLIEFSPAKRRRERRKQSENFSATHPESIGTESLSHAFTWIELRNFPLEITFLNFTKHLSVTNQMDTKMSHDEFHNFSSTFPVDFPFLSSLID
jgi:hypothetical protein